MTRTLLFTLCFAAASACTVVKLNPGDTTTIEYEGGADVGKDLADRACRKAGQQSAEIVSTVNKDKTRTPGSGKQVTTFRCVSGAR